MFAYFRGRTAFSSSPMGAGCRKSEVTEDNKHRTDDRHFIATRAEEAGPTSGVFQTALDVDRPAFESQSIIDRKSWALSTAILPLESVDRDAGRAVRVHVENEAVKDLGQERRRLQIVGVFPDLPHVIDQHRRLALMSQIVLGNR
jgi:hypothetical protein